MDRDFQFLGMYEGNAEKRGYIAEVEWVFFGIELSDDAGADE